MKLFASLLFVGTFAAVTSSYAQDIANRPAGGSGNATDDAVSSISGIHRPTPAPGEGTKAKAAGPMEIGIFKDAKGKSAASTFSPNDTVYLVCENIGATKGDKLSVAWYGDSMGGKSGKSKKLT